ncbi:hypothetical protein J6590_063045, partial [Homalodisca vitripennis]
MVKHGRDADNLANSASRVPPWSRDAGCSTGYMMDVHQSTILVQDCNLPQPSVAISARP